MASSRQGRQLSAYWPMNGIEILPSGQEEHFVAYERPFEPVSRQCLAFEDVLQDLTPSTQEDRKLLTEHLARLRFSQAEQASDAPLYRSTQHPQEIRLLELAPGTYGQPLSGKLVRGMLNPPVKHTDCCALSQIVRVYSSFVP